VLVDTSVLLNVLDVPGRNQDRAAVFATLVAHVEQNDHLLLPMAAIVETGNHIAHVRDGNERRSAAQRFVDEIRKALQGDTPWRPVNFPTNEQVLKWLHDFPDRASAGIGFGDLSIIKEWETCCTRFPMSRVKIWALDEHLGGFDRVVP
jgi:hypothetical protein